MVSISIERLLDREKIAEHLLSFYELSEFSIAVYPVAQRKSWLIIGEPQICEAVDKYFLSHFDEKNESWLGAHTVEEVQMGATQLMLNEQLIAYLLVGRAKAKGKIGDEIKALAHLHGLFSCQIEAAHKHHHLLEQNHKLQQREATTSLENVELRQMEEALRHSEERYRIVAEYAGQLHYDWDITTGNIQWDGRIRDIIGYESQEFNAFGFAGWNDLLHPADREQAVMVLDTAMKDHVPYICEYRLRKKDGSFVSLEDNGCFLYNERDEPVRMLGACKDITARKKYEAELQQRNEELMRFTYTASHDLRTPLITIKAFLAMLERGIDSHDPQHLLKYIGFIANAANKMTMLLDELLELSRVGRIVNTPMEISLQEVVGEALDLIQGRLQDRNIEVQVTSDIVRIFGDRPRLVEVFQNLLDNAAKFMGRQTALRIEVGAEQQGDFWKIFVRDNGLGIDPRFSHKVFGLFERINTDIEGTGIGLALVKRIVEVHGGKIWFESAGLQQGTTFYFTLPVAGASKS